MLFPTATFALFFAAVLPFSWLLMRRPRAWRPFMLAACYLFYAAWDWRYVALLAGSTVGNHVVALALDRSSPGRGRKWLLAGGIGANVALLGYFKYEGFFLVNAHNLVSWAGIELPVPVAAVALPLGISFLTFHAISYLVDTYRGTSPPTTLAKLAVYFSFFPHVVAGPISRPREFLPQLDSPRDSRRIDSSWAFLLIAGGLVKKLVIANELATRIVDPVFGAPAEHSSLELLAAVYAYAIQIWADFSGYTDIAIGVALLLGFQLPRNFAAPYTAVSLTDFWGRWHITLSHWLRDYLFFPLARKYAVGAASRVTWRERLGTYWSLFLTMVIAGLWHGAGWTFIAWGAVHGLGLAVERAYRDLRRALGRPATPPSRARTAVHRIVTFNVVCFAWVFFRADSLSTAGAIFRGLLTQWGEGAPLVTAAVVLGIAAGLAWQFVPAQVPETVAARFSRLGVPLQGAVLALGLALVAVLGPEGVPPFIYFRF